MTKPKLTIVVTTAGDYDGFWSTLVFLRQIHDLRECEIIVVDNRPTYLLSKKIERKCKAYNFRRNLGVRYVPLAAPQGSAPARNKGFAEARADWVLCIEGHLSLQPGAIAGLLAWIAKNPDSRDLLTGPNVQDDFAGSITHLNDYWNPKGRWGIYGKVFLRPDGTQYTPLREPGKEDTVLFCQPKHGAPQIADMPPMPAAEATAYFPANPPRQLGLHPDDDFEIPAQGLGAFCCRKDAFASFNEHFRGVGGSDYYYHVKHQRTNNAKSRCLGVLGWVHRYDDEQADQKARPWVPHKSIANTVRNYVLGLTELGEPLDRAYACFVGGGLIKEEQWQAIVAAPVKAPSDEILPPPEEGPGKQLGLIIKDEYEIEEPKNCICKRLRAQMNRWGVEGCRDPKNRAAIIAAMKKNYQHFGWGDIFSAAGKAFKKGLPKTWGGMYDLAVEREAQRLDKLAQEAPAPAAAAETPAVISGDDPARP